MADVFARFDAARQGGPVAAASIGSVSVSYAAGAGEDLSPAGQSRALYRAAAQYLDIYRGVRPPCKG